MGRIAFVYPGQGSQQPGMGLDLKKSDLLARFAFTQADQLRPGTSDQCFFGDEETLKQTANTQPCLYTVAMAARRVYETVKGHHSHRMVSFSRCSFQRISCSRASNSGVEKNSPNVISNPSQSFLMLTIPGFLLSPFKMLLTVL